MSEIKLEYEHLENAQSIFNSVQWYFDEFDWGEDGDWEKNCKAVMKVIRDNLELEIRVFHMSSGEESWYSLFCYHKKLHTWVELREDMCNECSFYWPLDVVSLIDWWVADAERFYELYQIKES